MQGFGARRFCGCVAASVARRGTCKTATQVPALRCVLCTTETRPKESGKAPGGSQSRSRPPDGRRRRLRCRQYSGHSPLTTVKFQRTRPLAKDGAFEGLPGPRRCCPGCTAWRASRVVLAGAGGDPRKLRPAARPGSPRSLPPGGGTSWRGLPVADRGPGRRQQRWSRGPGASRLSRRPPSSLTLLVWQGPAVPESQMDGSEHVPVGWAGSRRVSVLSPIARQELPQAHGAGRG